MRVHVAAAAARQGLGAALSALIILSSNIVEPLPALAATDSAAIGKCLLSKCQ